ncbi:hypothetical protein P9112_012098 [Eukaryota sp. TZLM1-RC]
MAFQYVSSDQCWQYPILVKLSDFEWSRPQALQSQNILISITLSISSDSVASSPLTHTFAPILIPSQTVRISVSECFRLPVSIADLSPSSTLSFSLVCSSLASTTDLGLCSLPLFDNIGRYSSGWHTLKFCPSPLNDQFNLRELAIKFLNNQNSQSWLDHLSSRSMYNLFLNSQEHPLPLITVHLASLDLPVFHHELLGDKEVKNGLKSEPVFDPVKTCQEPQPLHSLLSALNSDISDSSVSPPITLIDSIHSKYSLIKPLTVSEKQVIWRCRNSDYLRALDGGLLLFLVSVDWSNPALESEAIYCLSELNWKLPSRINDLLLLLPSSLPIPSLLEQYGLVDRILNQCTCTDFNLFIFPLVQSFRFLKGNSTELSLMNFLVSRAVLNIFDTYELHWILVCEMNHAEGHYHSLLVKLFELLKDNLSKTQKNLLNKQKLFIEEVVNLGEIIANPKFEKTNSSLSTFATTAYARLSCLLRSSRPSIVDKQSTIVKKSVAVHLPTHQGQEIVDVVNNVKVYTSNFYPVRFTFTDQNSEEFSVIFKKGDDLRQDYFILKLIQLSDKLLKSAGIDAKLTPYKAIPLGFHYGLIEYVPNCRALSEFTREELFHFLRTPRDQTSKINHFTISCAAYTIITFCFGIRDRHLDNLLLSPSGCLFHIDFGYMLDVDPKPFQTPIRMDERWVYAMGEEYFGKFREYCCLVFSVIRRHSHLFLALFALITDSQMTSIINSGRNVISKVAEKFRLDLSEEEAQGVILDEIDIARRALAPKLAETIHRWNQMLRSPTI